MEDKLFPVCVASQLHILPLALHPSSQWHFLLLLLIHIHIVLIICSYVGIPPVSFLFYLVSRFLPFLCHQQPTAVWRLIPSSSSNSCNSSNSPLNQIGQGHANLSFVFVRTGSITGEKGKQKHSKEEAGEGQIPRNSRLWWSHHIISTQFCVCQHQICGSPLLKLAFSPFPQLALFVTSVSPHPPFLPSSSSSPPPPPPALLLFLSSYSPSSFLPPPPLLLLILFRPPQLFLPFNTCFSTACFGCGFRTDGERKRMEGQFPQGSDDLPIFLLLIFCFRTFLWVHAKLASSSSLLRSLHLHPLHFLQAVNASSSSCFRMSLFMFYLSPSTH